MLRQTTIAWNGFLLLHEPDFRVEKRTVPIDALKDRRRRPPEFAESRVLVQSCHKTRRPVLWNLGANNYFFA